MSRSLFEKARHFLASYLSPLPSYLIFFPTARCNARCSHCFYREQVDSADAAAEPALADVEKLSRSLPRLIYLSLGGGEPFLRPDLADIVRLFHRFSGILYCNIVTNGVLTERIVSCARRVLSECPDLRLKVQVSIDDFEEAHDRRRRLPGAYAGALETVRGLRRLGRRLQVDVATCLTRSNKARFGELHRHLRETLDFDYHQVLYPRGRMESPEEKEVSAEEYARALAAAGGTAGSRILAAVNRVGREGILRYVSRDEHPWYCLAGRKFASITEKGVLQPCEVLSWLRPDFASDIADLRGFDFDAARALGTPKAREVADFIRDTKCRCSFECAANCNVVFAPGHVLKVLRAFLA
jgi:MoaA/NifB/PqqE/SkfB family radical SAM enzyme